MGRYVRSSEIGVGDIIFVAWDTHPFVVVSQDAWYIGVRNCTSHPNSSLKLIKVVMADKTGDTNWAGKDSYVVVSGPVSATPTMQVSWDRQAAVGETLQYPLPDGSVGFMTVRENDVILVPAEIPRFTGVEQTYLRIGTIKPARMNEILQEIG